MANKRPTIKNDPFATVIPDLNHQEEMATGQGGSQAEGRHQVAHAQKKEKITVHLSHELIERVRNAAYWNPRLTIAGISELGIAKIIAEIERENGGPYPPRDAELKGGRPQKTS